MDVHRLTPAQLAVAPPEYLAEYGVDDGNSDALNPSSEILAASADFMNTIRAVKIIEGTGSMTREDFEDVMVKMLGMTQ